MLERIVDRIEGIAAPHARALSIAAIIWFWAGIALYAGFIRLPELPWLPKRAIFWAGIAFNAAWWGWVRPAIEQRRQQRASEQQAAAPR